MAVLIIGLLTERACNKPIKTSSTPVSGKTAPDKQITLEMLLDAIEQVESGGDPNALGDDGKAIGSFQIHKIYVDEVNRILKKEGYAERYSYDDRYEPFTSRVMTIVHCGYWHNENFPYIHFGMNAKIDLETAERLARIHNSGPDGWKKECTKPYWEKVEAKLQEFRRVKK